MDHSIFYGFFTTLLGGDETAGVELFDWMKGLLVTPEIKPHKAIALVGPPGCGKHAVAELLRRMLGGGTVLMGEPYSWIPPGTNLMDRTRRFDGHTENALVVCFLEPPPTNIFGTLPSLPVLLFDAAICVKERYQPVRVVPSFHRVLLTANVAIQGSSHWVEQIRCHPPPGDQAAHFEAFYALLEQATPDDLRDAVLSYAVMS